MAETADESANRKRTAGQEENLEASNNKKLKGGVAGDATQQMSLRILCEAKQIGALIGKGGATIKQIREESGANVDIADSVPGARQRIVTVRGNVDTVANALHLMADKLQENRSARAVAIAGPDSTAEGDDEVTISVLVPQCQIGGVIGKGGAKINATRESSGANVKISEQCMADSTEKNVAIKGTSEQVYKALILVCYHVLENADKEARHLYWPKPDVDPKAFTAPFNTDPYGLAPYTQYGGARPSPYAQQIQQLSNNNFGAYGNVAAGNMSAGNMSAGAYGSVAAGSMSAGAGGNTENMVLPIQESLIGFVIGRGGSTINEIRQRSRASIKISEKQPGAQERMVTITGTRQANELAVALMNDKLAQHDISYPK